MNKDISLNKWLLETFDNSPLIGILLELFPTKIGSAINTALSARLAHLKKENFKTLMEQLSTGEKNLTPDLINTDEFIHAFFAVTEAALRTHRKDKIKALANLLLYGVRTNQYDSEVIYEFIDILDQISIREFRILCILDEIEKKSTRDPEENDLQFATKLWDEFQQQACLTLDIKREVLPNLLVRLTRTGLFEIFTGSFLSYTGNIGKTTQLFNEFIKWIDNQD